MFTGIVEELGSVAGLVVLEGHARLEIACTLVVQDAGLGDSIAVNGCCVTVTALLPGGGFSADLMAETLAATSLAGLVAGAPVNLERAMSAQTRFGGHIVQGHVDGVGVVVERRDDPGTTWLTVRVPAPLGRYLVAKGSVTLDGTSLTVVEATTAADGIDVQVALIPHTLAVTTWGARTVGDRINVEADVMAKYVERLLEAGVRSPYSAVTDPAPAASEA